MTKKRPRSNDLSIKKHKTGMKQGAAKKQLATTVVVPKGSKLIDFIMAHEAFDPDINTAYLKYTPDPKETDHVYEMYAKKFGGTRKAYLGRMSSDTERLHIFGTQNLKKKRLIDLGLSRNTAMKTSDSHVLVYKTKMINTVREFIQNGADQVFIPIGTQFNTDSLGHMNFLVFYPKHKIAYRFEPHGLNKSVFYGDAVDVVLQEFIRMEFSDLDLGYAHPTSICPIMGPQNFERNSKRDNRDSFCMMFSYLFAGITLDNPVDTHPMDVITALLGNKHLPVEVQIRRFTNALILYKMGLFKISV